MKRIGFSRSRIDTTNALNRASKSPLNRVPAKRAPKSREKISALLRSRGTSPARILCANPSARAVLPTPVSPTNSGLFFLLRASICTALSISLFRPTRGSKIPSEAWAVRLLANASRGSSRVPSSSKPPSGLVGFSSVGSLDPFSILRVP